MPSQVKHQYVIAVLLLLLASAAFGADVQINGVCVAGTCPPPAGTGDALQLSPPGPSSNTGSSSQGVTVNGDSYTVSWTYSDSFTAGGGTTLVVNPTVTYIGGTTTTSTDPIDFNFFQNFYSTAGSSWQGTYTETVPLTLSGGLGAGSNVTGELFYTTDTGGGGGGLGLVTLTTPNTSSTTTNSVVFSTGLTGTTLEGEAEFVFTFDPGTTSGAAASSPPSPASVPEPSETLPVGLALVAAVCCSVVARRRFGYTK